MTQEQLAQAVHISRSRVSRWETHVIYWYRDEAAAISDPEHLLKIEYVVNTADTICVTTRTEIVEDESAITSKPVDKVTCVSPDHHGKDWHLVIRRHPQRGDKACHWELYLENECGDYQPLEKDTVFYMPYPHGHKHDETRGCAVDSDGNKAVYEIYHYNADYDECEPVTAEPTLYGIKFVVSSLSPFVLDWGDFQVDLTPEQGGNEDGSGDGEGEAPSVDPEWSLQRLELRKGKSTVKGVRVKDLNVSTRSLTTIDKSTVDNLAIEFSKEENQSLKVSRSTIHTLHLIINRDTLIARETPAATIGADNDIGAVFILIPHPNEEDPEENEWPGVITKPLITFEGSRTIQLLILEENRKAVDPNWLGSGVTIAEAEWPDNETGQPVPYETFKTLLNQNELRKEEKP